MEEMKKLTFAQGIVFDPPFETDYEVTINYIIMKDELIIDGIRYKRVEEELTLEDCVKDNEMGLFHDGGISNKFNKTKRGVCLYPTEAIAEKVLLYGLLQSVAYKLNEGKTGTWVVRFTEQQLAISDWGAVSNKYGIVGFSTKELAEQAIRIFENSKFDLKKLFQ
jgi:hypothetical protein